MWYEPEHWDKDLNASDDLDRDQYGELLAPVNPTPNDIDEWYPAIMQEFTYLLMEPGPLSNEPNPAPGQVGQSTKFVFPVGMRAADLFTDMWDLDISSENALYGYGLTSLDADFDGVPDIVHVESELTLFRDTLIAADFDGDGEIDPLDRDGFELSGDELLILRLDPMSVPMTPTAESYVQFLDHLIRVDSVYNLPSPGARFEIFYTGDLKPKSLGTQSLGEGDMFFFLRGKDCTWVDMPAFAEVMEKISSIENVAVDTDFDTLERSYMLCSSCDLIIARHTSLADEAYAYGKQVIVHDYSHNSNRIIGGVFNYLDSGLFVQNKESLHKLVADYVSIGSVIDPELYESVRQKLFGDYSDGKVRERMRAIVEEMLVDVD